ncbi:hypothetical protein CS078_21210 [Pseudomonas prosekii]|uniref:Uncharacterized protein n=1 Tax=Pseudomonas prosekii TaxID=1148509 RepID=A0A3L8CEI2_9PSED|nr:hypothetical protein CS076_23980 [Pseudomonas prosekii]RLU06567.1 hypothetical protein CS078_21210 [Pseudomonas prosekii]
MCRVCGFRVYTKPLWERACSRKGHHIQHQYRLTHRLREQARSHKGIHAEPILREHHSSPVGAWLAGEEAGTFSIDIGCADAFAGKPRSYRGSHSSSPFALSCTS